MKNKIQIIQRVDEVNSSLLRSPIVKGLIDGGLSLIPFIGQAIASALESRAFQMFEENSKRFVDELRRLVEHLDEDKLDRRFIDSEEFVCLLTEVLSRNARTHEKEKVKLFARVFVNSAIHGMSEIPYKEGFIKIIDELSMNHIRILSFICEKITPFTEGTPKNNRNHVLAKQVSEELSIPRNRVLAYCEQMIRFGLLRDWGIGRFDYEPGSYEFTDYGKEFAQFLQEEV